MVSSNHPHPDLHLPRPDDLPVPLARQDDRPEAVGVTVAGGALGVEPDLAGGEDALLDGVDLGDEVALAGQSHVAALQENLEVGRPPLLGVVGEVLGDDLREVAGDRREG